MKNLLTMLLVMTCLFGFSQQSSKIQGRVVDEMNSPLPGVNVTIKGTTIGTITDVDGKYSFAVENAETKTIVFSFIGYTAVEKPIADKKFIEVRLQPDMVGLDEVIVTALGIKRSEKSLTYSAQSVSSEELNSAPSPNMLSNLSGKSSGVVISEGNSGIGGSVSVLIRGSRSIQGNNQPLYVVDGVPITNLTPSESASGGNVYGGGVDAGSGISSINPEDIESISLLKGASASALYGSMASNGVILITTKSAKSGNAKVDISSSWQMSVADVMYDFQNEYGQTSDGSTGAWGAKQATNKDFINDFFDNGHTFTNSVSVRGGSEGLSNSLSYSHTKGTGIVPGNEMKKHILAYGAKTSFFDKLIELGARVNLSRVEMDNPPSAPGGYFNPLTGLYRFPSSTTEFNKYKNNVRVYDPARNYMTQNWPFNVDTQQNPYWITQYTPTTAKTDRVMSKLNLDFNLMEGLKFTLRGNLDKTMFRYERKAYAGTQTTISHKNGRYQFSDATFTNYFGEALLTYHKAIKDFDVNTILGTSISNTQTEKINIDSDTKGLYYANIFNLQNVVDGGKSRSTVFEEEELQSVYGSLSLGYKSMAYLDITGRNDWSSTLPEHNRSFFYGSLGTSLVITEMMKQANIKVPHLTFAKVRYSYSEVGNGMSYGITSMFNGISNTGDLVTNTITFDPDLNPERTSSQEFGLDLRLFDGRLGFDVAYYKTNTKDQRYLKPLSASDRYSAIWINAGEVENRGFEINVNGTPIETKDFKWSADFNFSTNESEVKSLPKALDGQQTEFKMSKPGFSIILREGGEYGDIYARAFQRDEQGRVVVNDKGIPQQTDDEVKVGNINADFRWSLRNEFSYKGVALAFLIDARIGGQVLSNTQTQLSASGLTQATADARNAGGIFVNTIYNKKDKDGKILSSTEGNKISAHDWYVAAPISESGIYDADNIRLREVSLAYTLPKSMLKFADNIINSMKVSFVARNLFFLSVDAPFDPENVNSTTTNASSGDNFGLPMQRSYGVTLNIGL